MTETLNQQVVRELKTLIANIEAGNVTVDDWDCDNLNPETAKLSVVATAVEGKDWDMGLS